MKGLLIINHLDVFYNLNNLYYYLKEFYAQKKVIFYEF